MERRLAAILVADVVGYARLTAEDESGTHSHLKTLRAEILEPAVARNHGRVVKLMGDGVLVEFGSAVDAVTCAIAIQTEVERRQARVAEHRRVHYRIGINIGDVIRDDDDDVYGDAVIVAARLEPLAEPGGVWVSRAVHEYSRGKISHDFEAMGEHRVKNVPEPVEAYRVVLPAVTGARPARRVGLRRIAAGAGLAAIAAIVALLWLIPWQTAAPPTVTAPAPPASDLPSLAVMPFANLSADADDDYFADGLTDDLITDLSKISGLMVIARNTVFTRYKDRTVDAQEVGAELGVRYVLEGSLRRAGDQLRINAQLVDSRTGGHLWAERFDRDSSDIFAVQDEVIRQIVDTLAVQLSPSERKRVERLPTANLEAYDTYLRAEQAARTGFVPNLRLAFSLYDRAEALDPNFAEAYAADARTSAHIVRSNYDNVMPGPVARKRAYERASRALEIDPETALPFAVLAILQTIDSHHEEALISAERAVALAPNEAEAHVARGLVLTFSGLHAEAVAAFETAMRLNPRLLTGDYVVAALAFILNDQPERTIEILERARASTPEVDDIHTLLAAAYALTGRTEDARRSAVEARRLSPVFNVEIYRIVFAHFRNPSDLERILDAVLAGGLPRWPFGYTPGPNPQLTAGEIKTLVFGRTLRGLAGQDGNAMMQITAGGALAYRSTNQFSTGRALIIGDQLCERIEGLSLGRPACGPVYRNLDPASQGDFAYTYVNASKLFHFSPVE